MDLQYYSVPLHLNKIIKGKIIDNEVDIREAIHQNIRLMLKTLFLSYRFDNTFGCLMNKYQGSTPPQGVSDRAWREKIRQSIQNNIKDMLQRYETRVKVSDVIIDMQVPKKTTDDVTVKLKIQIRGNLTLGRREKFHFPDSEIEEDAQEVFPLMIPVK